MLLPLRVRVMFPESQPSSASPLPRVRGFPALWVLPANPTSTAAFAFLRNDPFVQHTRLVSATSRDHSGSLRFLDASISERAVLSDPAAVSSHHRLLRWPTIAFQPLRRCRPAVYYHHEAQSLHLRYGLLVARAYA